MTLVPITPLPPAPSRADDADLFVQKADAFVAALVTMVTEFNAAIAEIPIVASAINYNTTSSTAVTVGTGSKVFTIPVNGILQVGQFVIAASASVPSNYMAGQITAHDTTTGTLTVNVASTGGSGSHSDWIIAVTVADILTPLSAIAVTGSGSDLVAASVTYAKVQNVSAASKLLGRGAGSGAGVMQEISLGTNLTLTGTTLNVSSGTATLGDGDYGDIVVSGTGTVIVIDAGAVTYSKMQNVSATDKILGRSTAGAGVVEEISCTPVARTLIAQTTQALMRSTGLGLGTISILDETTAAQFRSNVAGKALSTDKVWSAAAYVSLTQASTIAVDLSAGINFTTTMTGNRTLGAPSNTKNGQSGVIEIIQDATGGRTLAFNAAWKFAGAADPTLSTAANAKDYLFYVVVSSAFIIGSLIKGVA